MTEHPSEAELQEFALDKITNEAKINTHIQLCDECKVIVANYRLLFSTIATGEKPVFDFDLSAFVSAKIQMPEADHSLRNLNFYIGIAVVAVLVFACYWCSAFLSGLWIGFGSSFMYLLVSAAIIILIFQAVDIYKRYQHKIRSLDFY